MSCFSGTISYIHTDHFLGESWWAMLPCGENVTIEGSCPGGRAKPLKLKIRGAETMKVCNTAELAAKIKDFDDLDRYLIGKVCEGEESSIQKY